MSLFPCLRTESGNVSAGQNGPTLLMTNLHKPLGSVLLQYIQVTAT
jgi:hypothetical protein